MAAEWVRHVSRSPSDRHQPFLLNGWRCDWPPVWLHLCGALLRNNNNNDQLHCSILVANPVYPTWWCSSAPGHVIGTNNTSSAGVRDQRQLLGVPSQDLHVVRTGSTRDAVLLSNPLAAAFYSMLAKPVPTASGERLSYASNRGSNQTMMTWGALCVIWEISRLTERFLWCCSILLGNTKLQTCVT